MVILAGDASKMAQGGAAEPARPAGGRSCDANQVETIQSVLRHFLGEMTLPGLGKS
jgi:hypothetical protein